MFSLKSDCDIPDDVLKELRNRNHEEFGFNYKTIKSAAINSLHQDISVKEVLKDSTFSRAFPIYSFETDEYFIFKINLGLIDDAARCLHLQQWINHEAIIEGVLTAKIITTDTSHEFCPFDFQIMEYINGQTLYELRNDEELVCDILTQVSKELNKLHDVKVNGFGLLGSNLYKSWNGFLNHNYEKHLMYLSLNKIIDHNKSKTLFQYDFPEYDEMPCLLHGDLSYNNIIVKNRQLMGILDWDDALFCDPVFDLANFATFHPEKRYDYFLNSFKNKPDDFYQRFWLYFLRISVAKAVHRHRFGYVDNPAPGYLPANSRIDLALEKLKNI